MLSYRTVSLMCLFALAAPAAMAQSGGLRPVEEGQPAPDLGGWLGEEELAEDPLAAPAPQAETPPEPELSPAERRKRERQIDKNYDDAQKIYQEVLNADQSEPLERRIAANERIVRECTERIRQAREERRTLQVELFNRALYLKQQKERGQITDEAYAKLIAEEERKAAERNQTLKQAIEQWTREVRESQQRLDDLKAQRRMLAAQRPRALRGQRGGKGAEEQPPAPGERLLSTLQQRMQKLDRFRTRHTLLGVHPRDVGVGTVSGGVALDAQEEDDDGDFFD